MTTSAMLLLAALCLVGLASASLKPAPHVVADKDFLIRQKKLLDLVWHVGHPVLIPEFKEIASSFKLEDHVDDFKDPEVAKKFVKYYSHGYFKKGRQSFTIHHKFDEFQAKPLVDLLYNAKDFETFFKTAVWARAHLSEDLFVYSLLTAKLHRDDLVDVVLPPLYEIYPQLFVSPEVIKEAWEAVLEGKAYKKDEPYVVRANYSGYPYPHNADELLSYFTEDVGLNAYLDLKHFLHPFWAKTQDYNQVNFTHRGDQFYYGIKATLSRYYLERLSHHLPDIEPINYDRPFRGPRIFVEYVSKLDRRLCAAVDTGYVYDSEFKKHSLRDPQSIDIFGSLVEGNADSINKDFYASFYHGILKYLAYEDDPFHNHHEVEDSILDRPACAFRSPLYYKFLKRVESILDHFKYHLGPYSEKELLLPGVKVESLTVDKLVTFFEDYDFELNNAIPVATIEDAVKLNVVARMPRLKHKPFNYHVKVTSDKDIDVFVRFFIGPRYNVYGEELSLNDKSHKMFHIDSFVFKLKKGENELVRSSKESNYYGQLPFSFSKLYKATADAISGGSQPYIDDFFHKYGDVEQLALPHGTRSGLPLTTYVIITPYSHETTDGIGAMSFPFDRPIDDVEFNVPNSYFGEAVVLHRKADEAAAA